MIKRECAVKHGLNPRPRAMSGRISRHRYSKIITIIKAAVIQHICQLLDIDYLDNGIILTLLRGEIDFLQRV